MQTTVRTIAKEVMDVFSPVMSHGQLEKLRPDVERAIRTSLGGREVIDLAPAPQRRLVREAR